MDRTIQKLGLVNLLVLLLGGISVFFAARAANSPAGEVAALFIGLGFWVAAVSYFQMRLEDRERVERMEFDELARSRKANTALFDEAGIESLQAQRSRQTFERFFVPVLTVLLFLVQAGALYWYWRRLGGGAPVPVQNPLLAMAIFGLLSLVLYLLGKYSGALARSRGERLLRPGAAYLLLGAYLLFIVTAGLAAVEAGFPEFDRYVARFLLVVLGFVALETLLNLILEIYRPRIKGTPTRLLYESRLVGLLGEPEGLVTTAAHALDYQFGFKVSDTWFYQFLQRALAWIIAAQVVILLLSSTLVFIDAGEHALLERFGKPVAGREVMGAGLHFKWPWPFDRTYRYRTDQIQSFNVGFVPDKEREQEQTLLWTVGHYKEEFNLLVASRETAGVTNSPLNSKKTPPVSLLSVSIPVQYQITNLFQWAYRYDQAGQLLQDLATREVVRYLVSADLNEIMSRTRGQAALELQKRIQAASDEKGLGAHIVFVGLQDIHPPVAVGAAYEKVVGALQTREARILAARAHVIRTNALAGAAAYTRLREAEAGRTRSEMSALARAAAFTNQLPAYAASPTVYAQRAYLQTLIRAGAGARKYVITTTNAHEVIQMNLEDKLRADLLDLPAQPAVRR